ncbi:hypothetical protein JOD01_001549 [Brevibacillus fulvus]|uniref:Uncharacterized protein n=1 Tax=Brevibacillus fulvus TaxID=1125967 RepID=A0A938XYF9_9BACL|nr:hypothetical protein [Brevibacillus fulvus]
MVFTLYETNGTDVPAEFALPAEDDSDFFRSVARP